jgi:hypothetical protein
LSKIAKRTSRCCRQLTATLEPGFDNRADAEPAVALQLCWLKTEYGDLMNKGNPARYLAALPDLSKMRRSRGRICMSNYNARLSNFTYPDPDWIDMGQCRRRMMRANGL